MTNDVEVSFRVIIILFESGFNLIHDFESIGLTILSQFDYKFWVNFIHNFESIWFTILSNLIHDLK